MKKWVGERTRGWLAGAGLAAAVCSGIAGGASAGLDPAATVGPETCAQCHTEEYGRWKQTAHAALFDPPEPLHQRPRALEIASRLGLSLVRTDSPCLDCHYTPQARGDRVTARAGVACESCHGAARSWVHVHNNFEGRRAGRLSEAPEVTRRREAANAAAGMISRGRIYELYSGCFGCHSVPDERLVDVGGHPAGGSFDLVERYDKIRHTFVTGGRRANAPLSVERKRDLQLLGPLAELEHGLANRAGALTTRVDGDWARAQGARIERARKALRRLARRLELPLLTRTLAATEGLDTGGDAAALRRAADQLAREAREFFQTPARPMLAALDRATEPEAPPEAPAEEVAGVEGSAASEDFATPTGGDSETSPAGSTPGSTPGSSGGSSPGSPGATTPAGGPRPARSSAQGALRAVLRAPLSNHPVIDPGRCASCHAEANRWWSRDPHERAADRLLDGAERARRIAAAYYGKNADALIATGRSACSNCHGTVVTGEEAEEVAAGVSCQSCHGPAGKYFEPHKASGLGRPQRLALGVVDLLDASTRARVCASCHHVTDARLISAGHSTGAGFRLSDRLGRIVHWKRPQPDGGALAAAWDAEIARRGPPPVVQVVAGLAPPSAPASASSPGSVVSRVPAATFPVDFARPGPSTARRPPPARPTAGAGGALPSPGPGRPPLVSSPSAPAEPGDLAQRPLPELLRWLAERLVWLEGGGGDPR